MMMKKQKSMAVPVPLVRDALLSIMTVKKVARQTQFAKTVKMSNGYVCDVLALRRNISPEVAARIGKAYNLTRRQIADLHYRAAIVAGWKLPPLPADARVDLVEPEPGTLMRDHVGRAEATVRKLKAEKVRKARALRKAAKLAARAAAKAARAKPQDKAAREAKARAKNAVKRRTRLARMKSTMPGFAKQATAAAALAGLPKQPAVLLDSGMLDMRDDAPAEVA